MMTIGDLARHGRVSVRMLRHYDAIGLLRPAHVDPLTGYRWYQPHQLSRLNRIVALKELGFTLHQVQSILDEVSLEELRGMFRLRRAELQSQIAADSARLADIEARLQLIEREDAPPSVDVRIKPIPATRVAELTAVASGFEPAAIAPVITPLYDELRDRLHRSGLVRTGCAVAYYEADPESDGVLVHAAIPVDAAPGAAHGVAILDLPAIEQAATIVHHGAMENVMVTLQTLARWIDAKGYRSAGYHRELYLQAGPDRTGWVTELQEPIMKDR